MSDFPSLITQTLEGRVKLAYANNLTDEQIAQQEGITIEEIIDILFISRLPMGTIIQNITAHRWDENTAQWIEIADESEK